MSPTGSPYWQMVLLGLGTLFLLWEIWRGWRAGVVRAGLKVAAIVVSTVVGFLVAQIVAAPLGGLGSTGGLFLGGLFGCAVGVIILVVMWITSAVLFKKTEHQGSGAFRLLWGLGGAVCGAFMGLIILWGCISGIRALGAMAAAGSQPLVVRPYPYTSPTPKPASSRLADSLITLKDSLEFGPIGSAVEAVDPIPTATYELVEDIGQLARNQNAMVRFVEYPDIQQVIQTPRMAELLSDPAVLKAGQDGNFMALVGNKNLIAAVEDPDLAAALKKVDLRAALKFALEKPTLSPAPLEPAPSPTPKPSPAKKK